jgi:type III secretory pathway component EscV
MKILTEEDKKLFEKWKPLLDSNNSDTKVLLIEGQEQWSMKEKNMNNNTEFVQSAMDILMDHPEFNKEKFLKTNPRLKDVVEKAIKDREDRCKRKKYNL